MALAAVPLSHDQARPRLGCLGELRLLLPVLLGEVPRHDLLVQNCSGPRKVGLIGKDQIEIY